MMGVVDGLEGEIALEDNQVVIGVAGVGGVWVEVVHKICGVM